VPVLVKRLFTRVCLWCVKGIVRVWFGETKSGEGLCVMPLELGDPIIILSSTF
jgi:hypothetical protein